MMLQYIRQLLRRKPKAPKPDKPPANDAARYDDGAKYDVDAYAPERGDESAS